MLPNHAGCACDRRPDLQAMSTQEHKHGDSGDRRLPEEINWRRGMSLVPRPAQAEAHTRAAMARAEIAKATGK